MNHRFTPKHRPDFLHRHLLVLFGALFVLTCLVMASKPPADAHDSGSHAPGAPYGGCKEAYQAPQSEGADWCRAHGWVVGARYLVTPNRVLKFSDLPSCDYEDGSTRQGEREGHCSWNVHAKDGNGCGDAYLVIRKGRRHDEDDDRFVDLFRWVKSGGGWHLEKHDRDC